MASIGPARMIPSMMRPAMSSKAASLTCPCGFGSAPEDWHEVCAAFLRRLGEPGDRKVEPARAVRSRPRAGQEPGPGIRHFERGEFRCDGREAVRLVLEPCYRDAGHLVSHPCAGQMSPQLRRNDVGAVAYHRHVPEPLDLVEGAVWARSETTRHMEGGVCTSSENAMTWKGTGQDFSVSRQRNRGRPATGLWCPAGRDP